LGQRFGGKGGAFGRHPCSAFSLHVHIETTVGAHGSVTLDQLPYEAGQRVEVTISPIATPTQVGMSRYPLSGMKVEYDRPFEGVAEGDWEAAR
jgi:hypothetical protein